MQLVHLVLAGAGATDIALLALRAVVGVFFAISGFHKLFNAQRHASLLATLKRDHIPAYKFNSWWVPSVEFIGGVMLTIGLVTTVAALLLLVVCIVACWAEAREKVEAYKPIDTADRVDDWLYLPEVLYAVMLYAVLAAGPGALSLDYLIAQSL